MKHLATLLITLLSILPLQAQELSILSFTAIPNDLSARTTPRKDANNVDCALVRVYVYDNITSVEGGAVGDVITKGLEKWVYLCEGVKTFKLNFQYHYPIEVSFAAHGLTHAEPATVYVLKISDGRTTDPQPSKQTTTSPSPQTSPTATPSKSSRDSVLTFTANGVSFSMIKVDGGTFMMGAGDDDSDAFEWEKPRHQVTVSDYYIGQTEVTQALWKAVMGNNPSRFKDDKHPVERVSWNDCQEFISKLEALTKQTFSLPTEAEWEFAARGGNKSRGYKYSGSNNVDEVAWYEGNGSKKKWETRTVATKKANELGLYDMSGNVFELCMDWSEDYSVNSQTDPIGSTPGLEHVKRGGSWRYSARLSRVSNRNGALPADKNNDLGLRLALHIKK